MSAPQDPLPNEPPAALLTALRRLLRPVVRLLLTKGIGFPFFSSFLKSLYVEVAAADFQIESKEPTVSRLSLLTGIHRREVKRLREEPPFESQPMPSAISLGAQVIARWTGEDPWIDGQGRPRALHRSEDSPERPSFLRLVRSVSVDIHPRSILDEWLRIGIAEIDGDDLVRLRSAAFVPSRGYGEKAYYVGRNLHDHIAASFENLEADESPHLERSVHYSAIPRDDVPQLERFARECAQQALVRVNERAKQLRDEAPEGSERARVNFGVYFYDEAAEPPEAEE